MVSPSSRLAEPQKRSDVPSWPAEGPHPQV